MESSKRALVKSFFNPNWPDLGILSSYGRWAGVNWVWAEELTIFHAVFSITIPILLVNLMFPARQLQTWVSKRVLAALSLVLLLEVLAGLFLFPYNPPPAQYLMAILAVVGLVVLGKKLPHPLLGNREIRVPRALRFSLLGALWTLGFFLIAWELPQTGIPPSSTMSVMIVYAALVCYFLMRMSGNGRAWSEVHQLATIAGALSFFIALAPLQEFNRAASKNTTGMGFVALAFIAFLAYLALRIKRRQPPSLGRYCMNCGTAALSRENFCHECGAKLL